MTVDPEIIAVAEKAILKGGIHVHNLFGKSMDELRAEYKAEDSDTPRTIIDTYTENAILEVLQNSKFKNDTFNPEESEGTTGKTDRIWHIDPFDGTSNAAINSPNSTVGLAVQQGEDLVAAVVLNPFENKLYWAVKDQGAFSYSAFPFVDQFVQHPGTEQQIKVSDREGHKKLYVTIDSLMNDQTTPRKLGWLADVSKVAMNLRSTGSNIDYGVKLAEGRTDIVLTDAIGGFFDVAPGYILVTEAGGCLGNLEGKQPKVGDGVVVGASNQELFERVLEITNKHYGTDSNLGMYEGFRKPQ